MDHERLKQTVLSRCKLYLFFAKPNRPTGKVDGEVPRYENWSAILLTNPSQGRTNARQQFSLPERLCQVVIGSSIEGLDLRGLITLNRQNDNRRLSPLTKAARDLFSADARESKIEKDEIRTKRWNDLQSLFASGRFMDQVSVRLE